MWQGWHAARSETRRLVTRLRLASRQRASWQPAPQPRSWLGRSALGRRVFGGTAVCALSYMPLFCAATTCCYGTDHQSLWPEIHGTGHRCRPCGLLPLKGFSSSEKGESMMNGVPQSMVQLDDAYTLHRCVQTVIINCYVMLIKSGLQIPLCAGRG